VATIARMNWAIYGALIVGALAVVGAVAFVVVRALQAWRAYKRLRRHVGRELARLADLGEVTTEKLEAASDTSTVERSLARLRVSLARAAVLRAALAEARGVFDRVAWVFPRK